MPGTLQATAVAAAQSMLRIAPLLQAARTAILQQNLANTDLTPETYWPHLPTFVWATDGTAGTADGTPNEAHPISTSQLNRSSTQLIALAQLFTDFETFMEGGALVETDSRNTTLDQIIG